MFQAEDGPHRHSYRVDVFITDRFLQELSGDEFEVYCWTRLEDMPRLFGWETYDGVVTWEDLEHDCQVFRVYSWEVIKPTFLGRPVPYTARMPPPRGRTPDS